MKGGLATPEMVVVEVFGAEADEPELLLPPQPLKTPITQAIASAAIAPLVLMLSALLRAGSCIASEPYSHSG